MAFFFWIDLFKDIVLDADYNDVSVSKDTLLSKIKLSEKNLTYVCIGIFLTNKTKWYIRYNRQLVSYGLLLPHIQVGLYWFTARKQGSFVSNISAGRLEILRILKKRSTKDIMEKVCKVDPRKGTKFLIYWYERCWDKRNFIKRVLILNSWCMIYWAVAVLKSKYICIWKRDIWYIEKKLIM